jgi:elongation factor Tu
MNAFQREPDVKVLFEFNGGRKNPVSCGYRPDHLIKDDYLTCGIHDYDDVKSVLPDGQAYGTICFITPEVYPACLWPGKRINIQEGARIVGYATVIEVLNPILCMSELDGAEILAISELGSYGHINIGDTNETIEIAYLAICRYRDSDTVYLFLCDKDFSVEGDLDFESIEKALENANARSKNHVKWNRNDLIEEGSNAHKI